MGEAPEDDGDFLQVLEKGVRDILKAKKATHAERMSAINAGAKLIAIKHKLKEGDGKGFFE